MTHTPTTPSRSSRSSSTSGRPRPTAGSNNLAVVRGIVSSEPRRRSLPSGDELVSIEVTTRPQPARGDAVAVSVPVVWFSPTRRVPSAGDEVVVIGHVARRFFRVAGTGASRTEVVADRVLPARRSGEVARALARAASALVDGSPERLGDRDAVGAVSASSDAPRSPCAASG